MKLHLPLRLLAALLAAISLSPAAWGATITLSGSSVTLDPKEYTDGLIITAEEASNVTMNSTSTVVSSQADITLSTGSIFAMEQGTLGRGSSAAVQMTLQSNSTFTMGGSSLNPIIGTGRGASINMSLTGGSTFTMNSGMIASSGASVIFNIENSSFTQNNGTISNGSSYIQTDDGGTSSVHSSATINVNEGGSFTMSSSSAYLAYAGGSASVHVNSGGVFTQNNGIIGFARGTEGGKVEITVHEGGRYSIKGGNIAVSNGKARITVENGGVFELGGKGKISGGAGSAATYADIVVKSGSVFNMTGGGIATDVTNYTPEAQLLVSGSFNQSGGDVSSMNGKAFIVVQDGGSYTLSGGAIGREGGTAALDICRGGSFTLRGSGSITGNVEIALGYTPEFSLSNQGSESLWGAPLTPDAPAETGSFAFVQEGGVIDGSVRVVLTGEDASYTQSGGEITGSVSVSVSEGASFTLSGEGELTGDVELTIGSGSSFSMSGGSISDSVSLTFDHATFEQSAGTISGEVSISLTGGSYTQSGGVAGGNISLSDGALYALQGGSISGGNIDLAGEGSKLTLSEGSSISDSTITLSEGAALDMSGGQLSGSVSADASSLSQSGGQMRADVDLQNGASMEQSGSGVVSGNISLDASTWVQDGTAGIAHGSTLELSGSSSFTQNSGSVDASISVAEGSTFTQGGLVSGDVVVSGEGSKWVQNGGNITDGSLVTVQQGASLEQKSGVIDAEITLDTSALLTQSGSILGSVHAQSGSTLKQLEGSSLEGEVILEGNSTLTQTQAQIAGDVSATRSDITQTGSSISGKVTLSNGATLTQNGSSIGSLQADQNAVVQQLAGSSITGAATLSGGSSLTQSADSSISGKVSLNTKASLTQEGGLISGGVDLSGGASLTQKDGSRISGGLTATQATVSQTSASIVGDVDLSNGSTLTQTNSSIDGNISLAASTLTQQSGSITGNVLLAGKSTFTQAGDIGGNIEVTGQSTFTRSSGKVSGSVTVADSKVELGEGDIGGGVLVQGGSYSQGDGSIGGSVDVTNADFTHGVGDINGGVTAQGSTLSHAGGNILGEVQLDASSLTGSAGDISGSIRLTGASELELATASILGGVTASEKSSVSLDTASVAGSVELTASSFTLGSGDITGSVALTASSFTLSSGNISGDVQALSGSTFKQESGSIGGRVVVDSSSFAYGGSILGNVDATNGSIFTLLGSGSIQGSALVADSTFTQQGSVVGSVTVSGKSTYTQQGNIGGNVTVSGQADYSMESSGGSAPAIAGSVSVDGSTFRQAGDIAQGVTLTNQAGLTMTSGETLGSISISGNSTLTQNGGIIGADITVTDSSLIQTSGDIGSVNIALVNSTFTHSGGNVLAAVTMSGADSAYDMGGAATGGSILLQGGNLKNAGAFSGTIVVDTDATYSQAISMGGVQASAISSVSTRSTSSVLNNVGNGTLTFSGSNNTMMVGTETSNSESTGKGYLINFDNAVGGSIAFDESGSITLNFSANVLKEAKEHAQHAIEIWFTNGSLVGAPTGQDELTEWLGKHFIVGNGLLGADDTEGNYGWQSANGGKITLHVNTDGIWFASLDGDVEDTADWELFNKHHMLIVDEDMSILQHQSDSIQIKQLTSGGNHTGDLTIELTAENTEVTLNNHESVAGSGNGDTVFNGFIILTGAEAESSVLKKTGEGSLTAGGITGAGSLQLTEGKLVLTGTGSSVGELEMASGVTLELQGSLALSGESELSNGSIIGGGELIQDGGQLTLNQGVTVQANLSLKQNAQLNRTGDVDGSISLLGNGSQFIHSGQADISGDIALSGKSSRFEHVESGAIGGSVSLTGEDSSFTHGDGDIAGDVLMSGDGSSFEHGSGSIGGSVTLQGAGSDYQHDSGYIAGDVLLAGKDSVFSHGSGDIAGSVSLTGEGSDYTHGDGDIAGDVLMSGNGSAFKHGAGSIGGGVTLQGAGSSFEMDFLTISGSVSLQGAGSSFTQTGDIAGSVELGGEEASFIGTQGNIGADVTLSGDKSKFSQGGEIAGNVLLAGSEAEFTGNGSSIGGNVLLSGDSSTFHGEGSEIKGSATLHGEGAALSDSRVMGDVLLEGKGSRLTQKDMLVGAVTLSGEGATLVGDSSGIGQLTLSGRNAQVTDAGDIAGDVLLSAEKTAVQNAGLVTGSVTLSGEGALFSGTGNVVGSVTLSGAGSDFSGTGSVAGSVTLSGTAASFSSQGVEGGILLSGNLSTADIQGDVGGKVSVEGAKAEFTHSGTVQSDVSISGAGATYRQKGDVAGDILLSGNGVAYTADGAVNGDITISGAGSVATISATGTANGKVSITAENATLYAEGTITGETLLSGKGSVLDLCGASGVGSIYLQAGALNHAEAYNGPGVVINTTDAHQGELKLGGLQADKVLSVSTGSGISISGLAQGSTLTFAGINTMYADKASASYSGNSASAAMIRFNESKGNVAFADGGQLRLRFDNAVRREFGSGTLEVWLTDGSIAGMPQDDDALLAWLHEHILLATGSGQDFALEQGDFSGAREGWLTISASTSDIWVSSEKSQTVTNPSAFDAFSKVDIDADTTLEVADNADSRATIRQLEGDKKLTLSNKGSGTLTVDFVNEDILGYYGDTTFDGDIVVDGAGAVEIEKSGNAALELAGALQTPGNVSVKDGKLILNAKENTIGSLSLGDAATAGEFIVNGQATLTGKSDLSAATGSILGEGLLDIQGALTLGKDVSLSGVSILLEENGSLNLNGARSNISSLSGNGTLDLGAGGELALSQSSAFSGSLEGSGSLSTAGKGTELTLSGHGNENYNLVVGANTSVTLQETSVTTYATRAANHAISWHSVTNSGELTVLSSDGATALTATGDITLAAGSTTHITVNLSAAGSAVIESTGGRIVIEAGSSIQLSLTGQVPADGLRVELIRSAEGIYDETAAQLTAGTELPNISFDDAIFSLIYKEVNAVVDEDTHSIVLQATKWDDDDPNKPGSGGTDDPLAPDDPDKEEQNPRNMISGRNALAGFDLLCAAAQKVENPEESRIWAAGNAIAEMLNEGQKAEASRALAAVSGSSVPALGTAQRDALREQMLRMRDRVATTGNLLHTAPGDKRTGKVYTGIEATGSFAKLSADGDEAGYKLSSWGGTVSADVALKAPMSVGLALTALYGDWDADAADSATGNLDSYYVSLFMRGTAGKWSHSLVFTLGINSAEMNRTVICGDAGYTAHSSTDGMGLGALYELAYDIALNEQKTSILQPIFTLSALSSTMKGFTETGAGDAGLQVDDQSWTTISLGLGARWATMLSPSVFGRTALAELRLNIAQDLGDTCGEANVALLANPGMQRTIYGAEVGSTALQIGAGITIPVSDKTNVHLNAHGDLRSGATAWGISAGLGHSF